MRFWWEFFKDKRFAWDFKIANLIMGDRLRSYLAIDSTMLKDIAKSNSVTDFQKRRIGRVVTDFNTLMEGKQYEQN